MISAPIHNLCVENACFADKHWKQDSRNRPHDEFCNAGNHWENGIAHTLNGGAGDMQHIEDGKADAHNCEVVVGNLQCLLKFLRGSGDKTA